MESKGRCRNNPPPHHIHGRVTVNTVSGGHSLGHLVNGPFYNKFLLAGWLVGHKLTQATQHGLCAL